MVLFMERVNNLEMKEIIYIIVVTIIVSCSGTRNLEDIAIYECARVGEMHIPADTRSAFPVISVHSPVSIQCRWQS